MQRVNIICIGRVKEKYFSDAIAEYAKRLQAFCRFQIIELPEEKLRGSANDAQIAEVVDAEGVDFIIGGSYGLSGAVKKRADERLSMSRMTFPHTMARMILSEQIYRAFEIASNGKYHK